ncbi:MAG: cell division protein FtsA [Lachnospiraceae bacterium]|nr:cell division protein FtsA [Lachnospiraceae bacterium]
MKEKLVFGLDIGTRSVVGTVGYRKQDKFVVVTQRIKEHETRAMLDGQIHDIQKVGDTIREVKVRLEEAIGEKLEGVCIAAAGRVLFTVNTHAENEIDNREVTDEDIYSLISKGVENAYNDFLASQDADSQVKFYCVGHSVVRFYLNGNQISNLEGHKARNIAVDLIATFLPDEVVDGLYKAVEIAGLKVDNLTLEPIAAIGLAIPERFRMLNIALIDVGAGTSDISITNDGCILAYGMIPMAGDALTECIAKACLVDFSEAEKIKKEADYKEEIEYTDIMLLPQKIKQSEVLKIMDDTLEEMSGLVADKIKELNGGRSVSAVFIVGGGGKNINYAHKVADKLGIARERVALRGEEVMQSVVFEEDIKKDSLLVTPVGICLNYYEQSNNFIFVSFNGSRIKMYDNNNLSVGDVAMQAQFPNDGLFPKRGEALEFTLNGKARMQRGLPGEAALITINDEPAFITSKIRANDIIHVKESTAGPAASMNLEDLEELSESIEFVVNDQKITVPKFASVNGELQSKFYEIQSGDEIEIVNFYTVKQIADFMDVIIEKNMNIYVNNQLADMETKVYENFTVNWTTETIKSEREMIEESMNDEEIYDNEENPDPEETDTEGTETSVEGTSDGDSFASLPEDDGEYKGPTPVSVLTVTVNGAPVILRGKQNYVFVDVFDAINFNLAESKGRRIVTNLNGKQAQYMEALKDGDTVDIYWEEA